MGAMFTAEVGAYYIFTVVTQRHPFQTPLNIYCSPYWLTYCALRTASCI